MSRFGNRPVATPVPSQEGVIDDEVARRIEIQRALKFYAPIINQAIAGNITPEQAKEILDKAEKDVHRALIDAIGTVPPRILEHLTGLVAELSLQNANINIDALTGTIVEAAKVSKTIWKGEPPVKDFPYSDRSSMLVSVMDMQNRVEAWSTKNNIPEPRRYFIAQKISDLSHEVAGHLVDQVGGRPRDHYNLMQSCMRNISESLLGFIPEEKEDRTKQVMDYIERYSKRLSETVETIIAEQNSVMNPEMRG